MKEYFTGVNRLKIFNIFFFVDLSDKVRLFFLISGYIRK